MTEDEMAGWHHQLNGHGDGRLWEQRLYWPDSSRHRGWGRSLACEYKRHSPQVEAGAGCWVKWPDFGPEALGLV